MVNEAIKQKFDVIGISDHVPYKDAETMYRMEFSERNAYLEEANYLKNIYKNSSIKLYIGYEAEYQKRHLNYLISLFKEHKIDYLVLGHHYQDVSNLYTYYGRSTTIEQLRCYVNDCIEAMKTKLFWFIAHPDIVLMSFDKFTKEMELECRKLISASIDYNVYLEYNGGGVRNGYYNNLSQKDYLYPKLEFWKLVKEMKGKVLVNADAHSPYQINDEAYKLALKQAKKLGLNLVEPDYYSYIDRLKLEYDI
jgi:histidinol-phosphatase (PHP family)